MMKVLDSGEVKVLAVIETGDYFGEMALFSSDGGKRTASVRAVTYCDLFALSKNDFEELLAKSNNRPLELKIRGVAERRQRQTKKMMTTPSPDSSPGQTGQETLSSHPSPPPAKKKASTAWGSSSVSPNSQKKTSGPEGVREDQAGGGADRQQPQSCTAAAAAAAAAPQQASPRRKSLAGALATVSEGLEPQELTEAAMANAPENLGGGDRMGTKRTSIF